MHCCDRCDKISTLMSGCHMHTHNFVQKEMKKKTKFIKYFWVYTITHTQFFLNSVSSICVAVVVIVTSKNSVSDLTGFFYCFYLFFSSFFVYRRHF